jgi:Fe-S-cluster-containing hydrogenase component 2
LILPRSTVLKRERQKRLLLLNKILVCDESKCTGCQSCEVWCGFHHFQECSPSLGRLRVIPHEDKGEFVPVPCHQCRDAWCLSSCPFDAMSRDEETGAVVISQELCTACLICIDACPFEVIKQTSEGEVFKCDLCQGDPVCVWSCTRGAITYSEPSRDYLDRLTSQADRSGGAV